MDEPTAGLHPADTKNLMKVIGNMRDAGNTVVIVEHDLQMIENADHLIETGPGPGNNGGKIVASGTPEELAADKNSITGRYLFRNEQLRFHCPRPLKKGLTIKGANAHNLKDLNLHIPSEGMIALTGVSGSGKSTLMFDVIARSWHQRKPAGCISVEGFRNFDRLPEVSQRPVATSRSSNTLTYTGLFDRIRDLFAHTENAGDLGLKKADFSLNVKGGRCEACQGTGKIKINMDFVSDVMITCDSCRGKRYTEPVLACKLREKNINDILEMTVEEAVEFFHDHQRHRAGAKNRRDQGERPPTRECGWSGG